MSDFKVGDTFYHHFSTRAFATGVPTTLAGTPVAEAYEEANATGLTAGVSLTIDHAETGHHLLTVVATGANSFETGKSYGVSLTAGTVDSVSVVGEVIFNFTLEKSPAAQDLANGTDGLGALKTLIDTVNTDLSNGTDGLGALKTLIDTVNTDLSNGTDGLGALKTLIDALNDISTAQVNTEVDNAIVTYGLDHLVFVSVTGTDIADNSIIAKMVDDAATADWDGYDNTTASLEALNVDSDAVISDLDNGTDGLGALKALVDTVNTDLSNGTDGLGALKTLLDAIPTTMRGTDNAALASVVGALNDAAAADEVTAADTLVQYVKQLINILVGTPGVVTLKAAAAPASGVSLSEMIRAIYDDTNSLDGTKIPDTLSLANINAEADTALDTTIAELSQGVPATNPTMRTAVMLMYMALRNKLDVATSGTDTLEIHNDAGTRIAQKLLTDDGSDYSEAKITSGA